MHRLNHKGDEIRLFIHNLSDEIILWAFSYSLIPLYASILAYPVIHHVKFIGRRFRMERADITVNENSLIESIKEIIITSRKNIVRSVNTEMLSAYWNIGKLIIENEQKNQERAQYGEQTLKTISKRLTAELGSGFSLTNLKAMRKSSSFIGKARHCLTN